MTTMLQSRHATRGKLVSRLQAEFGACRRERDYFLETARALTSVRDHKAVLRIILDKAKTMVRCEAWSLFLIDPLTKELIFEMVGGPKAHRLKGMRIPAGRGIVGWVAKHKKPALVIDTSKDPRFLDTIDRVSTFKTRSILCLPIINRKRPIAVLEMLNKLDKPFDSEDLDLLSRLVEQASIALERANLYKQASSLGITDELTKLYNSRYLEQVLDREVRRCRRYGSIMALIFLDLDSFKSINDLHGHERGSQVLAEVAGILLSAVRSVDTAARYGGDEFVIILPETPISTAHIVAERIRQAIAAYPFLEQEEIDLQVTASIGVAALPEHAKTKQDLLEVADKALYRAKTAGRNRVLIAEPA